MHFDWHPVITTWQMIRRNKMRSFLTSLGIIIGISSVIIIISLGAGAQSLLVNEIKSVGSDLIGVLPGASESNGPPASVFGINITTLKYADGQAIKSRVPEIVDFSGYVRGAATVSIEGRKKEASFVGVNANYLNIESTEVVSGRFFTNEEDNSASRVVVLGSEVAEALFNFSDPLDTHVKINKETFDVIGVMKSRGSGGFQNQDNEIYIPLNTGQKIMLGINYISLMRLKVASGADVDSTVEEVKKVLRDQHGITDPEKDDFSVRSQVQTLDTLKTLTDALSYFLAMVAGISLIVGGIGIMNIMLVSITESTREIGLRKAVGARRRDISIQYLIQTVVLSMVGGLLGIFFGVLISWLVSVVANYLGYAWDFVITWQSVVLAVGFTF
ncbi:MAG: Multidrug transporter substrate-binding protein, partial [Patescibacteria group bacterium]|nr:Multidrug transporter substrate-binding protein [Patescibacteria group bacterium]